MVKYGGRRRSDDGAHAEGPSGRGGPHLAALPAVGIGAQAGGAHHAGTTALPVALPLHLRYRAQSSAAPQEGRGDRHALGAGGGLPGDGPPGVAYGADNHGAKAGGDAVGNYRGPMRPVVSGQDKKSYAEELKAQMLEKRRREAAAAAAARKADELIEKSIQGYDPWGKAGAGAPHRDEDGHVVADLRFQRLSSGVNLPKYCRVAP